MATAVIKDNHIKVSGIKFFRANAPVIEIGSYGKKKEPITAANYLEVQERLPAPKMDGKIKQATVVEIDTSKTTKNDFLANINALGVFGVSGGTAWTKAQQGHYKLIWLTMTLGKLKDAFNSAPKARNTLADMGGKGRAVHQVLIALEASEATKVDSGTSFDVSVKAGILNVNVKGGSNSSSGTDISIAPGTCFAYLLANPDWNKGKTKIDLFKDDQYSFG